MKACLPVELKEAMGLDDAQFETLEENTYNLFEEMRPLLKACGDPLEGESAWRDGIDAKVFFAIKFTAMIDADGVDRFDITGFKPMKRSEYMAYCVKEFGEAPPDMIAHN